MGGDFRYYVLGGVPAAYTAARHLRDGGLSSIIYPLAVTVRPGPRWKPVPFSLVHPAQF